MRSILFSRTIYKLEISTGRRLRVFNSWIEIRFFSSYLCKSLSIFSVFRMFS
nr:MAG TPA: hypothetical protein [Crassvirales sp.]